MAKERVFALYKSLGDLKARNLTFINALRLCASLIDEKAAEECLKEANGFLYDRADELMVASSQMIDALESLYPQLEIINMSFIRRSLTTRRLARCLGVLCLVTN